MAASVLCAWACHDPVDKAAKQRIFSPEDPPKVLAAAAEKLPPEHIADDPAVARRVLQMGAAEATERLGPHAYNASVTFEWTQAARSLKLTETRTLKAAQGGVGGDFYATVDNTHDQGLEVMRVAGDVFAKNKYAPFRQRKRDRGMAERAREDVYGTLRDFDALFRGRLKLESEGTASYEGRTAWKYAASLAPARADAEAVKLPPLAKPKSGRDPSTERRARFFEKRSPRTVSGEVWVDSLTSVVLKARLDGRMAAPGDKEGDADLHLVAEVAVKDICKDPELKAPPHFLPDVDKPEGIADALDRFGIPRTGGQDGGVEAEPDVEETP